MIICKSPKEIESLKKSNRIVAFILEELRKYVQPGVTTIELDQLAEQLVKKNHCIPAFKGYRGYPASLCVSVNDQIVHGIPGNRKLQPGSIVSLDLGVKLDGYYGDAAITVPVGEISPEAQKLLRVTREALYKGIEKA
ncbi:MAG: M24 family metallopeptidase, partial [Deltaproteobacteria bacterium]|nr:M24 family metallopeptidase [Deltaproteobacteria bacterium]